MPTPYPYYNDLPDYDLYPDTGGFPDDYPGNSFNGNINSPLTVTSYLRFTHLICEGPIGGLVRNNEGTPYTVDITKGSAVVTCTNTTGLENNLSVFGRGIPVGTFVVSFVANTSITLSQVARVTSASEKIYIGGSSGLESVFFNETPLQNANRTFNFKGWQLKYASGEETQDALDGVNSIEAPVSGIAGSEVKYGETTHIATISNTTATAARVIVVVPTLYSQDTTNGNYNGSYVEYVIERKAFGESVFTVIASEVISGKALSQYARATRINLTGTGPWQIRVRRITPDATLTTVSDKIYWSSMVEITELKLSYPNSAVFAGALDASQIENIPNISYFLKLLIVKVPKNYDPITRVYASTGPGTTGGVWDGTFKEAWTDNPAWCFYDLVTNARYGLGDYLDNTVLDKWGLYDIGQYCDGLVPDGMGGMEPRFTCNLFLQSREEAFRVIANFASIFRGMVYWANGQMMFYQDKPSGPSFCFTQANVKDGTFNYSGAAKKARHSIALVRWNDNTDFSRARYEYVEDTESVRIYGVRELEVTGFGCTSRAQARRLGLWALLSEREETEIVQFTTGLDAVQSGVFPGSIINIIDPHRANVRLGGRILQTISSTSIQLDAPVVFEVGKGYALYAVDPNGSMIVVGINNPNTTTDTITLSTPLSAGLWPLANSVWSIAVTDLQPQSFRLLTIEEKGPGEFLVTALEYNNSKYAVVEQNAPFDVTPIRYWNRKPTEVYAPTGLTTTSSFNFVAEGTERQIDVNWAHGTDAFRQLYIIEYSYGSVGWTEAGSTENNSFSFSARIPQDYSIRVRAKNAQGYYSVWVYSSFSLPEQYISNAAITGLELQYLGNATTFSGKDPAFVWRYSSPDTADITNLDNSKNPLLDMYVVRILNGVTVLRQEEVADPLYVYTAEKNNLDTGGSPVRTFTIQVAGRDKTGHVSVSQSLTVTNPAPLIGNSPPTIDGTKIRMSTQAGKIILSYDAPTDSDFAGMMVFVRKGASGFALTQVRTAPGDAPLASALIPYDRATNTGMLLYKGTDTNINIDLDPTQAYEFIVAPYDLFGMTGLNYYGPASNMIEWRVDTTPPATPTGVVASTRSEIDADGSQRVTFVVKFTPNSEADLSSYGWKLREITGAPVFSGPNLTGYTLGQVYTPWLGTAPARKEGGGYLSDTEGKMKIEWPVKPGTYYEVSVSAVDESGNSSAFSALTTSNVILSAADSVAPAAPTSPVASSAIKSVFLSWVNPSFASAPDYAYTNIYRNTTASFPGGTPYAKVSGTSFVDSNVVQGTTYYYYLKSEDASGNETASPTSVVSTTPGLITTSDITNFSVNLTKQYTATIALAGASWTDNSNNGTPGSLAGSVYWNAHTLYYQGVAYSIAAGSSSNGYIYWNPAVSTTVYQTSATNPALTDAAFMIATNVSGVHDLAWNAIANALIGTAYIENLAVTNAKILSLAVDKLTAGTISSQAITITGAGGYLQSGNYVPATSGFKLDANTGIVYAVGAVISGNITITSGTNYAGSSTVGGSANDTILVNGVAAATISQGAARANAALNAGNNLVTAVIPGTAVAPSGAGLYLGSNYLGYYNGSSWKTYMDNTGNFYLTGAGSNGLSWNGTSLTITGILDVGSAIERTLINDTTLMRGNVSGNHLELYSNVGSGYSAFRAYNNAGNLVGIFGTELAFGYGMIRLSSAAGVEKMFLDGTDGTMVFSNVVRGPYNNASGPTYTFSSRTSDGMYSAAAGNLGFACNGKAALNITESANGFGMEFGSGRTGDGSAFLDLIGKSGDDYGLRLIRNGGLNASSYLMHIGTGALNIYAENNGAINITSGGTITVSNLTSSGNVTVSGAITATGNVTAYYSDERLKTRLGLIEDALSKVCSLDGFYYHGNVTAGRLGYSTEDREVGVSAQQVQAVMPEIIRPAPINPLYMTLDYSRLAPLFIESFKEVKTRVECLEEEVASLKRQLAAMRN